MAFQWICLYDRLYIYVCVCVLLHTSYHICIYCIYLHAIYLFILRVIYSRTLALAATVICWLYPTLNKSYLILSYLKSKLMSVYPGVIKASLVKRVSIFKCSCFVNGLRCFKFRIMQYLPLSFFSHKNTFEINLPEMCSAGPITFFSNNDFISSLRNFLSFWEFFISGIGLFLYW